MAETPLRSIEGENLSPALPIVYAAVFSLIYTALALPELSILWRNPQAAAASAILCAALAALSAFDLRHMRLPDALTLPLASAGIGLGFLFGWVPGPEWRLAAALSAYIFVRLIDFTYARVRGRNGIGLGDAKLMAAAGAWLGFEGLPSVVLYASAGALTYVAYRALQELEFQGNSKIPFGPFLAAGFWLVWIYGPLIL